jgi:hypothetical protein
MHLSVDLSGRNVEVVFIVAFTVPLDLNFYSTNSLKAGLYFIVRVLTILL